MTALRRILLSSICLLLASVSSNAQDYFYHTVAKGQGLYSISRTYGVTEEDIIKLNPGSEKVIRVGQELKIPQKKGNDSTAFHTVAQGETLYELSRRNNVTIKEICDANPGLSVESLKAGMVIVIPSPTDSEEETVADITEVSDKTPETGTSQSDIQEIPQYKKTVTIARRVTIYRICKDFDLTQEEFYQANPQYRTSRLRVGDKVNIPYSAAELEVFAKERPMDGSSAENGSDEIAEAKTDFDEFGQEETDDRQSVTAAFLLPFSLDDPNAQDRAKMIEFYRGVLLAVEDLKNENISVTLKVIDTKGEDSQISPIMASDDMNDVNVIIGPKWGKHIATAAEWSTKHNVPIVLPFNSNADEVFGNPHVFQLNTPQSYFHQEIYDHFLEEFKRPRIIVIDAGEMNRNTMLDGLLAMAEEHNIPTAKVDIDSSMEDIMKLLDADRKNIFIINTSSSGPLVSMLPVLQLINRTKDESIETSLFGYPEYQIYAADHMEEMYECDTWFYSWFYTNNLLSESADFSSRFIRSFSRQMMVSYPGFAQYGYDTAYYFLKGIAIYGDQFEKNLDRIWTNPVQMGFKFERVNNWGGFINRKVFFVHFTNEYQVEKIDFDK